MTLPFTPEQFLDVFRRYNGAVWPFQAILLVLGLAAAGLGFRPRAGSDRLVSGALSLLWAWMGVVYHLGYFRSINPAAVLFGALFLAEALLFLHQGVLHSRVHYRATRDWRGLAGGLLLVYAFVLYPLLGRTLGRHYPAAPTFGLPCPTTIATIGLLLWVPAGPPVRLAIIPLLWAIVGTSAAFQLGIREDLGLGIAGLLLVAGLLAGRRPSAWAGTG